MADDEEVLLLIEGQEFKVRKSLLCENSDYFRAMFSGNYVENEQKQIVIDVVDAASLRIIIQYMKMGLIDLFEYSLCKISEIAMAANFLQITELIKQIEYTLQLRLSRSNWPEIMSIAENSAYTKLQQYSAAFGLLCFNEVDVDCIKSIEKLYWYLSHPYLNAKSELEVFKFGLKWATANEIEGETFMLILCCLDMHRLTLSDVVSMKSLMIPHELSLAAKVVDCLHEVLGTINLLTVHKIREHREKLCEMFTEIVYTEVLHMVQESKHRQLKFTAVVPFWTKKDKQEEKLKKAQSTTNLSPYHYLYTFREESGFLSWLEIAEKSLWGWGVTTWGPMRLVIVCGEHGRGTGMYMRDVKVYDVFKKEWISHGVQLPPTRHAGLTVLNDSLYIVGGVGAFRVVLDTALIYDLKARTFREIAKFHDTIQNPAVCTHDNRVYVSGMEAIYRYEASENCERWYAVVRTNIRMSCMTSFKGYIYCTQSYFSNLYRFRPDVDKELEIIAIFTNPPATICNLGECLLFFTRSVCGQTDALAVEEHKGTSGDDKAKVVWSTDDSDLLINDVAGCCAVVIDVPPNNREVSPTHNRFLKKCANVL